MAIEKNVNIEPFVEPVSANVAEVAIISALVSVTLVVNAAIGVAPIGIRSASNCCEIAALANSIPKTPPTLLSIKKGSCITF